MGLMGLIGCTADDYRHGQPTTIEATALASSYDTREPGTVTRTWTPPTGYKLYSDVMGLFEEQVDLSEKSIGVFLTKDGEAPLQSTFFFKKNATPQWHFDLEEITAADYYLYGYIPKEAAESSAIVANTAYSDGAVLTLTGLRTVTHNDVSIMVAAKEGTSDACEGLQPGSFKTKIKTGEGDANKNYVYLLFDHLFAALRFSFKVDAEYARLRTIKLTKLELTAYDTEGNRLKAKYNATVTLAANTTGASPIESVVFTPDESSADVAYEPIFTAADDGVALQTDVATSFMGSFVPGRNTNFRLRSTYDVYDRKDNLVRKGCEAVNDINIRSIFSMPSATELTRGTLYSLTLTVRPTYLYVLSEPDLDSPSVTVGGD